MVTTYFEETLDSQVYLLAFKNKFNQHLTHNLNYISVTKNWGFTVNLFLTTVCIV